MMKIIWLNKQKRLFNDKERRMIELRVSTLKELTVKEKEEQEEVACQKANATVLTKAFVFLKSPLIDFKAFQDLSNSF